MATLNLDNYLPSIFRKRPVPLSGDIPIDDPSNVLAPMRGDAPASVNTTDAGTNLAAPVDLGTADTGTTRPRRVETDDKGRPIANTTMTGDAQAIDLNQRVHAYHPQASQGWWDKWGKEMVTGAVKGLRYGPGGALGGAIAGGVRGRLILSWQMSSGRTSRSHRLMPMLRGLLLGNNSRRRWPKRRRRPI